MRQNRNAFIERKMEILRDFQEFNKESPRENSAVMVLPALGFGYMINETFDYAKMELSRLTGFLKSNHPDPDPVAKLDRIVSKYGDSVAAMGFSILLKKFHIFGITTWSKDIWENAIEGHEVLKRQRILPHQIPTSPQIWFINDGGRPGNNMLTIDVERVTPNKTTANVGILEAIIIDPISIDSEGQPCEPEDAILVMILSVLRIRVKRDLRYVILPVLSYQVGTLPEVVNELRKEVPQVHEGMIATDEHGVVVKVVNQNIAATIVSAALFMQEPYIETSTTRHRQQVLMPQEGRKPKPVEHTSYISQVELRKKVSEPNPNPTPTNRNYTKQWFVKAHWRTYKDPIKGGVNAGKCVVRIPRHIKGPEDKPLVMPKEHFTTVTR